MTEDDLISTKRSTRVLFLVWGFSIHSKRRIQIFVDDPSFEVAVVSTHNYNFENANNFLLTGIDRANKIGNCFFSQKETNFIKKELCNVRQKLKNIVNKIGTILDGIIILLSSDIFSEIKIRLKDFKIIKSFLLSAKILSEAAKGIKDFKILKSAVREFNPDVIFLQTLLYPCYLAYFLRRSIPIIITFWNGDVIWSARWNWIDRLLKEQIVTYGVRRARAITVNSQMAYDACLRYDVEAEKIHIIRYPGVDLKRFKSFPKDEARKKLGIACQKVVLCPRGLGGYLNSDVIVDSAADVIKKYPNSLFLFISGVGSETELRKHQQRVRELGIEKNFRWDGQVPWDMMIMYYNSSDVMVSISSVDSLPNCMLEAMACEVPIIMGDISQIREWVVDGSNGFLVPIRDPVALADRILKVFENHGGNMASFTRRNLELVRHNADDEKNVQKIKDLVHTIAKCQKSSSVTKTI